MPPTSSTQTATPIKMEKRLEAHFLVSRDYDSAKWYVVVFLTSGTDKVITGWGPVTKNTKGQWKELSFANGFKKLREKRQRYNASTPSEIPKPAKQELAARISNCFSGVGNVFFTEDSVTIKPMNDSTETSTRPRRTRTNKNPNRRWI